MEIVSQLMVTGLISGGVYILIALGLALAFSILRILNFAHGEFYMMGAYVCYLFSVEFGLSYWLALPLAIIAGGLLGVVVDQGLLRRVGRDLIRTLILTLGLILVMQVAAMFFFGTVEKNIPTQVSGWVHSPYVIVSKEKLSIFFICLALIFGLFAFIRWAKLGRAMRAIAQDREAAILQGINVETVSSTGFAIGCALAAAAGALMGVVLPIGPFMGQGPLIKALTIIVLGGLGSIPGVALGGLILGQIESFVTFYWSPLGAELAFFFVIILVLFIRPRGLLGGA